MKEAFFCYGYAWQQPVASSNPAMTSNKYGNGLVSSAFRNISTDTSTVTVAAMLIDSLETSGKELILLGEYTHPVWGKMSASGYVSYNRPSYNTDIRARRTRFAYAHLQVRRLLYRRHAEGYASTYTG